MKSAIPVATNAQYVNINIGLDKPETMKTKTEAMGNQKHHSAGCREVVGHSGVFLGGQK